MKKRNETDRLNETVASLENKRDEELRLMKEQLHLVHVSIKPVNLVEIN